MAARPAVLRNKRQKVRGKGLRGKDERQTEARTGSGNVEGRVQNVECSSVERVAHRSVQRVAHNPTASENVECKVQNVECSSVQRVAHNPTNAFVTPTLGGVYSLRFFEMITETRKK